MKTITMKTITVKRVPLAVARQTARRLIELLLPACDQIVVAGSVRRCCRFVKDIELVAISAESRDQSLFAQINADCESPAAPKKRNALDREIERLMAE